MSSRNQPAPSIYDEVFGLILPIFGVLALVAGFIEVVGAIESGDPHPFLAGIFPLTAGFVAIAAILLPDCEREDSPARSPGEGLFATITKILRGRRGAAGLVDITELPADIIDPVRPLLPSGTRRLRPDRLHELYAEATRLMEERARFARAERDALERHVAYEQARAAAAHLRRLSDEDRALLELRMRARADADARAARDFASLEREIAALRDACARFSQFHFYNSPKG